VPGHSHTKGPAPCCVQINLAHLVMFEHDVVLDMRPMSENKEDAELRQTMLFAAKYHQLATLVTIFQFTESDGCGIWLLNPITSRCSDSTVPNCISTASMRGWDNGSSLGRRI
jgi:hypothetical protein